MISLRRRLRTYASLGDVALLEASVDDALRAIPVRETYYTTAPCTVTATQAGVTALVRGAGLVRVAGAVVGDRCDVKSTGSALTITDARGGTIDGSATLAAVAFSSYTLVYDGLSGWWIV